MVTLQQLKKQRADIISEADSLKQRLANADNYTESRSLKKEITALRKRLPFIKTCILYLELSPSEEFIQKEKDRISNLIEAVNKRYSELPKNDKMTLSEANKMKKEFEADYEVPKYKSQLKALNFLLK